MELNKNKHHMIDSVFVICLMLLFVLSALSVIALGASIYKKNVALMADNNSQRIACAYVTEKVRQADKKGAIYAKEIFGENALVMSEEIGGKIYNTYIYDYEGHLCELYAREDLGTFYPQSGQKILEVTSFDVQEVSDTLLGITIVLEDGSTDNLYIAKRSTPEG
ncbi:DUF4860 domain-containing protein [Butyrivibrio sp. AE2032]|jgi:hypothetical protein|uniref:DUF4860 domain-containing protein n=1 Tax=Butyrivibrio sp. AE2032 TaxID=1458463 RepID=UPI0006920AC7|nr:DUF4860 domain-containing protein [Butyrivibrio sp. AE2032]